jgi:hypothetical protein
MKPPGAAKQRQKQRRKRRAKRKGNKKQKKGGKAIKTWNTKKANKGE